MVSWQNHPSMRHPPEQIRIQSNFINLFVNVITFVITFEMLVQFMFVHNRATENDYIGLLVRVELHC